MPDGDLTAILEMHTVKDRPFQQAALTRGASIKPSHHTCTLTQNKQVNMTKRKEKKDTKLS